MSYHPHLHVVIPGGGLDQTGQWISSPSHFLFPGEPLSRLYRGKFRAELQRAGILDDTDEAVWNRSWVVDTQAVGDGETAMRYLAPYVYRVAISDQRMVASDQGSVTFRYRRSGSKRWRTMTVSGEEFIRRFLQHVLPRGLQKVRYYGFLSPNARIRVGQQVISFPALQWLVAVTLGLTYRLVWTHDTQSRNATVPCRHCGGPMLPVAICFGWGTKWLTSHPP